MEKWGLLNEIIFDKSGNKCIIFGSVLGNKIMTKYNLGSNKYFASKIIHQFFKKNKDKNIIKPYKINNKKPMKLTHTEQEVIDLNKYCGGKYEIEDHPQAKVLDIIIDVICLVAMAVITIGMVVVNITN